MNTVAFLSYSLFLHVIIAGTGKGVWSFYLLTLLLFLFNICLLLLQKQPRFYFRLAPVGLLGFIFSPERKRFQIPSSMNADFMTLKNTGISYYTKEHARLCDLQL